MPLVRPFRGLRYADTRPESMARVLAPPFDMIRGAERQALFAGSEHNIARLTVADDGPGYPGVAERLEQWKQSGVLKQDPKPAFYVYEQARGDAGLRGFLAAVRLVNPPECAIYPHENTFAESVMDRLSLMQATECSFEPVFSIYTDVGGRAAEMLLDSTFASPIWRAEMNTGAIHRLWAMTDPTQQEALSDIVSPRKVVIADGHHRWAAANAYREERRKAGATDPEGPHEYGLMLLVDEMTGGIECGAFHRIVHRLPEGVHRERIRELLGEQFTVDDFPMARLSDEEAAQSIVARIAEEGESAHVFGCRWETGAAIVRIDDLDALLPAAGSAIDSTVLDFDVALLHRLILKPRLRCRGDYGPQASGVTFEKDPTVAWRKASSGEAAMAWFVNPAETAAVMRVAFAGHTVPQKATHFHPKPPSGMVMYPLVDGTCLG